MITIQHKDIFNPSTSNIKRSKEVNKLNYLRNKHKETLEKIRNRMRKSMETLNNVIGGEAEFFITTEQFSSSLRALNLFVDAEFIHDLSNSNKNCDLNFFRALLDDDDQDIDGE